MTRFVQEFGAIDRRTAKRAAASRPAFVVSGLFAWECTIVDITPFGARVAVAGTAPWPMELVLLDHHADRAHRSRLAWRSETEAGLEFLDTGILVGFRGVMDAVRSAAMFLTSLGPRSRAA